MASVLWPRRAHAQICRYHMTLSLSLSSSTNNVQLKPVFRMVEKYGEKDEQADPPIISTSSELFHRKLDLGFPGYTFLYLSSRHMRSLSRTSCGARTVSAPLACSLVPSNSLSLYRVLSSLYLRFLSVAIFMTWESRLIINLLTIGK